MSGELVGITINHKTAPLEVRERLRLSEEQSAALRSLLARITREHLVLSTCERLEIYAVPAAGFGREVLSQIMSFVHGNASTISDGVRTLEGDAPATHLLSVAAGLESRIMGEPHVLGQVRQAYLSGLEQKTLGPILAALGRAAIHAGKRVRHETSINPTARSIVTVTLETLQGAIGELSQANVVIVGSGRLAGDLAAVLAYRGASLRFASRSRDRAEALALRHQAPAGSLEAMPRFLNDAHAVITCSSASNFVLTPQTWQAARCAADAAAVVVMDLSVPRNVDPALHKCHGVSLIHLDELLCREQVQAEGFAAGERIVSAEAERFEQWRRERPAAPKIAALSRRARTHSQGDKEGARRLHRRIMGLKVEVAA